MLDASCMMLVARGGYYKSRASIENGRENDSEGWMKMRNVKQINSIKFE